MRKWILILALALLMVWAVYLLLFGWVVPKTAAYTRPLRWQLIPLRQPRETVHGYLGEPLQPNMVKEEWPGGTRRKQYLLRIYYANDTTVAAYSVHYFYKSWLVSRDYLIDSGSIR